jgi:hypothetical protein
VESVEKTAVQLVGGEALVTVGKVKVAFPLGEVGGWIELDGKKVELIRKVTVEAGRKQ